MQVHNLKAIVHHTIKTQSCKKGLKSFTDRLLIFIGGKIYKYFELFIVQGLTRKRCVGTMAETDVDTFSARNLTCAKS